jgi:hypothetical protein
LTVRHGEFYREGHPYRGVGANYFDLFLRILADPTNTTSLKGVEQLSHAGIPFVRFATMYSAGDMRFFYDQRQEYFRRLDLVVQVAERYDLGLIPSLNWTLDVSEVAKEPRDQWGNPQSQTIKLMRQYVGEIVARYRGSPAIWAWEFGNEPNLAVDLPNAAELRKPGGTVRDDVSSAHIQVALSEFTSEVRRHDATRPIFSGNSHPRASAWHNTREKSWDADSREQFREILRRDNPAVLDTLCVHIYANESVQKDMAAWAVDRTDWLDTVKTIARENGRPLFVGEFGLPADFKGGDACVAFTELLTQMEKAGVDLAAFWVFDLPSQGDSWSVEFKNSRRFMLPLVTEANRRWNRAARRGSIEVKPPAR